MRTKLLIGGLLVALLGLGLWSGSCYRDALDRQEARVDSLEAAANRKIGEGAAWHAAYLQLETQNSKKVAVVARRDTALRADVKAERDTTSVPDTCKVVVARRDSLLDRALQDATDWQARYVDEHAAAGLADSSYQAQKAATDTLRQELDVLKHPPRKSLFYVLTHPEVRLATTTGPFIGICTSGQPCAGAGVSAGISLSFGRRRP